MTNHDLGEFWSDRWARGQIGFHNPAVSPMLERYAARLAPTGPSRVLVPLCGKSLDLGWLSERGHDVVGVEIAELAVTTFWSERGVVPERTVEGPVERYVAAGADGKRLDLLRADFFEVTRAHVGAPTAAFDRAALVALPEELRGRYASHLLDLLSPRARVLLVTFAYGGTMSGPPFSVDADEVRRHFGARCDVELLERAQLGEGEEARFRDRGARDLHEAVWLLQLR